MEIDDAYLGGERSGGKAGRGSENKVPFVAAVQTTPDGQPQFVCLRQQPFTYEAVSVFAERSIAPSAAVISDGLWCFGAIQRPDFLELERGFWADDLALVPRLAMDCVDNRSHDDLPSS